MQRAPALTERLENPLELGVQGEGMGGTLHSASNNTTVPVPLPHGYKHNVPGKVPGPEPGVPTQASRVTDAQLWAAGPRFQSRLPGSSAAPQWTSTGLFGLIFQICKVRIMTKSQNDAST